MKKIFLISCILFILAACSNNESNSDNIENEELANFIDSFNSAASESDNLEGIDSADVGEVIEQESQENEQPQIQSQIIYQSDAYDITATYEEDKIAGYSVMIANEQPYSEGEGEGIEAVLIIAEMLDLNTEKLLEEIEKTASEPRSSYNEGEQTVFISNLALHGDPEIGIIIDFPTN